MLKVSLSLGLKSLSQIMVYEFILNFLLCLLDAFYLSEVHVSVLFLSQLDLHVETEYFIHNLYSFHLLFFSEFVVQRNQLGLCRPHLRHELTAEPEFLGARI